MQKFFIFFMAWWKKKIFTDFCENFTIEKEPKIVTEN